MTPPATQPYPIPPTAVALIGFMGAGKTTVGKALAHKLGCRFVDLDAEIVARYGAIPALFAAGASQFRAIELEVLRSLPLEQVVLATGGGAPTQVEIRAHLEAHFHTVHLSAPEDVLRQRIRGTARPLANQQGLYGARQAVYASARTTVSAEQTVPEVVAAIHASLGPRFECVQDYRVQFDTSFAEAVEGLSDAICIADHTVDALYGDRLQDRLPGLRRYTFQAGEPQKTVATWSQLTDRILRDGVHRGVTVLALGGGVSGDMAGFVAATLLRGLPWRLLPTSTLAMVDSSVGGKTGVDHVVGKNLIGRVHRPSGVHVDLRVLNTLPPAEARAGLAEAVKTGLVADEALFGFLEHIDPLESRAWMEHVVALSVRNKARIIEEDEFEHGRRRLLNAGHTVGHALETTLGYGALRHGEAVAIGLVVECAFAEREGVCPMGTSDRVRRALEHLKLPTALPDRSDPHALIEAMALDKKATRDTVVLALPVSVGRAVEYPLPKKRLHELLVPA